MLASSTYVITTRETIEFESPTRLQPACKQPCAVNRTQRHSTRRRGHRIQSDADAHRRTRMIDPPNVPESACATPSAAQNPVATHQQTQPTYAEPCSSVMSPQPARRTTSGRTVTSSNRYELKPGKIVTPSPAHPLGAVKLLDVPSESYELNSLDVPETSSTRNDQIRTRRGGRRPFDVRWRKFDPTKSVRDAANERPFDVR